MGWLGREWEGMVGKERGGGGERGGRRGGREGGRGGSGEERRIKGERGRGGRGRKGGGVGRRGGGVEDNANSSVFRWYCSDKLPSGIGRPGEGWVGGWVGGGRLIISRPLLRYRGMWHFLATKFLAGGVTQLRNHLTSLE